MTKEPTPADWFGFAIRYRRHELYYIPDGNEWTIADGGGWYAGVYATPNEAVDGAIAQRLAGTHA